MDEEAAVENEAFFIRLKTTNDRQEVDIKVKPENTIAELKRVVANEFNAQGKLVRLIYSGKILAPDTARVHEFDLAGGSFVHCVITAPVRGTPALVAAPTLALPSAPTELRGLDRLMNDGLGVDEVAALRSSFRPQIDAYGEEHPVQPGESHVDYRARIEEEWMQVQEPTSEFALNVLPQRSSFSRIDVPETYIEEVGTIRDYIWGFFMGLLVGFIMLFWLWDGGTSHRQKMGILSGVAVNLCFEIMRKSLYSDVSS